MGLSVLFMIFSAITKSNQDATFVELIMQIGKQITSLYKYSVLPYVSVIWYGFPIIVLRYQIRKFRSLLES